MLTLHIIAASVRAERKGIAVARWIRDVAKADDRFDTTLIDLADVHLPMDDEPHHPSMQKYTQEHTKAWSRTIDAADAFVIVTPEYNYSFPASLKNALDHLNVEWGHKPVGFVSYGGISGGLRSVQQLKSVTGALNMQALNQAVVAPMVSAQIEDDTFTPNDIQRDAATTMLDALDDWGTHMKRKRTAPEQESRG